jgi:hypothetical protein
MMFVPHRRHMYGPLRPVADYGEREKKWVILRDTTEGTQFIIGFEGSQALPVCPYGRCKHLTGAIEV